MERELGGYLKRAMGWAGIHSQPFGAEMDETLGVDLMTAAHYYRFGAGQHIAKAQFDCAVCLPQA
jgi:hypothetical protein